MRALKRFGRDLVKTARSDDWFDWFILGVFVFLGVIGGMVASLLGQEFK
jgi:hypothetical protein